MELQGSIHLFYDNQFNRNIYSVNTGTYAVEIGSHRDGYGFDGWDPRAFKARAAESINGTNYVVYASPDVVYVWEMDNNWEFIR